MGPLKLPFRSPSAPPPPSRPTSPPSKRSPPHRHPRLPPPLLPLLPPPPPHLPLPPPPPPHLPLPPPPPLPLPPPPPLPYHLSLHSSSRTLPPPPPSHAPLLVLPRRRTPPPGSGASARTALPPPPPRTGLPARGDHSIEHLGPPARGFPATQLIRGDELAGVPPARGFPVTQLIRGDELAGVPPEMLPPKKRLVRYHPYEAAYTIQEIASHGRGGFGDRPLLLTVEADASVRGDDGRQDRDDGLRAELLRLRISRPALVLTKRLTPSDRSRDKACLVLPDTLVRSSPLLNMLTAGERRLVFSGDSGGLPVPAFDRLGRTYRMALKRDRLTSGTYRLTGQWSLFASRHSMRDGDTVEVLAFRPPGWQARLDRCGEGGLGMALLHCRNASRDCSSRENDAADGLVLLGTNTFPEARSPRRRRRRNHNATTGP